VRALFRFPDPVDEISARLVAAGVVLLSVAYVATGWLPLVAVLAYGFVARVLTGPTLSPLGTLVTRVIRPRLATRPRFVPGPPKRFAQGMGAVMSGAALVLALIVPASPAARVLVGLLAVAAFLESALALCLGCRIFAVLLARGLVPASVCEACADLSRAPVRTRAS
jgi:Domain of unknown function (DUF4395)